MFNKDNCFVDKMLITYLQRGVVFILEFSSQKLPQLECEQLVNKSGNALHFNDLAPFILCY